MFLLIVFYSSPRRGPTHLLLDLLPGKWHFVCGISDGSGMTAHYFHLLPTKDGLCSRPFSGWPGEYGPGSCEALLSLGPGRSCSLCSYPLSPRAENAEQQRRWDGRQGGERSPDNSRHFSRRPRHVTEATLGHPSPSPAASRMRAPYQGRQRGTWATYRITKKSRKSNELGFFF